MRGGHTAAVDAKSTLERLGIPLGEDFHALTRAQVDALLDEAKRRRYRRPDHANGSRARYFHDMMQRRAKWH